MSDNDDQQDLLSSTSINIKETDQDQQEYINLHFDGPKMKSLRWYISATCQWLPRNKAKRPMWKLLLVNTMRVLFGIIVLAHIPYTMGVFPPCPTLSQLELVYPITTIKNTVWNVRWQLSFFLGLQFFTTRVMEDILSTVKISEKRWTSAKNWIGIFLLAAFVMVLLVPVSLKSYELTIEQTINLPNGQVAILSQSAKWFWILLFAGLFLLNRVLTLPLFSVIITLAFILGMQIREFKDRLLRWDDASGLNGAKRAFTKEIKFLLRSFQMSARWYLSLHLFLLLVFSFLSVASCFERIYIGVPKNFTYSVDASNGVNLKPISMNTGFIAIPENLQSQSTAYKDVVLNLNLTQAVPFADLMSKKNIQKIIKEDIKRVIASEFLDFSESFLLYCLPFFLLARIGDLLDDLRNGVQDADHDEQIQNGYIFTEHKKVKEMKRHIESAKAIQVMGINMSFFKAILLTLFGPFVTSILHLMLKYIHFTTESVVS